ncbi:ATP synthase gamma chain [Sulfurovum sp. enrichment culture clone C5]|uniref:ATP synthase gamma chain n=1 Tax=Sulfurovum sp. enrichment culture clone C5 TaxID=497650 RepID=A0A0S4XQP4_9BACT|nr:ATP synthase gamma chain [Sulfurovum sp. enrichment culture clone C5]
MANLKDIKRKIKSVKNTEKTTRAMKLVSSAKLKRTEELAKKSKVYAHKLTELLSEIAQKMVSTNVEGLDMPYFKNMSNPKVVDLIFITADKGLCGGFNAQTIKRINALRKEYQANGVELRLTAIGRKGIDYFRFNRVDMLDQVVGLSSAPDFEKSSALIGKVVEDYLNGKTDKIVLVHNGYVNMITQEVRQTQVLPVDHTSLTLNNASTSELEVEPDNDNTLLEALVKKYIEYTIYYSLIDSLAAEHSARMQAMDSATNNAKDMVKSLSIKYNRARQEAITTELIEIISGMESMK